MALGLWDRLARFLGFGPEEDEEEVTRSQVAAAEWPEEPVRALAPARSRRPSVADNVVPIGPSRPTPVRVLVVEPKSFDDVQAIADQLKNRRPVILNLEAVDKDTAQRILNFLHGAIYALGGDTQKVASGIFFFAPPGVDVASIGSGAAGAAIAGGALGAEDLSALEQRLSFFVPQQQGTVPGAVIPDESKERDKPRPDWDWRR